MLNKHTGRGIQGQSPLRARPGSRSETSSCASGRLEIGNGVTNLTPCPRPTGPEGSEDLRRAEVRPGASVPRPRHFPRGPVRRRVGPGPGWGSLWRERGAAARRLPPGPSARPHLAGTGPARRGRGRARGRHQQPRLRGRGREGAPSFRKPHKVYFAAALRLPCEPPGNRRPGRGAWGGGLPQPWRPPADALRVRELSLRTRPRSSVSPQPPGLPAAPGRPIGSGSQAPPPEAPPPPSWAHRPSRGSHAPRACARGGDVTSGRAPAGGGGGGRAGEVRRERGRG